MATVESSSVSVCIPTEGSESMDVAESSKVSQYGVRHSLNTLKKVWEKVTQESLIPRWGQQKSQEDSNEWNFAGAHGDDSCVYSEVSEGETSDSEDISDGDTSNSEGDVGKKQTEKDVSLSQSSKIPASKLEQTEKDVSQCSKLSSTKLRQNEQDPKWLLGLAARLRQRVVGQDDAVQAVAEAVLCSRIGLRRHDQPLGSFLFWGPSGVGKTELAKALAEQLCGDEKHLVRFDSCDYWMYNSVSRLTEAVMRRPNSVILCDKIENAKHCFNFKSVLAQVLDHGQYTVGRSPVSFTNTLIIMTSTIGAEHLLGTRSLATTEDKATFVKKVTKEVGGNFPPELFNRLDEFLVFDPLSQDHIKQIARLQMEKIELRFADRVAEVLHIRGVTLDVTDAIFDFGIEESYDWVDGAPSVQRWLERKVITQLSSMICGGEIYGNCTVYIDVTKDGPRKLIYTVKKNGIPADGVPLPDVE